MLKPYYRLEDFPDRRNSGKSWVAECPNCGHKKLYIDKKRGLFNCFYAGCEFKGMLDDYRPFDKQHDIFGEVRGANKFQTKGNKTGVTVKAAPSVIPEDYESLSESIVKRLKPLRDDAEVVRYLEEQKIPLLVGEMAGCMSTVKDFDGKPHHCICYVNRVNGNIVNVKYRAVDQKLFCQDSLKDKDIPSAPFNIECLNPFIAEPKTLIITEGEKDVLTLMAAGYESVISVPNGSSCKPDVFMEPFLDWMKPVRRIIICGDNDRSGRKLKVSLNEYFRDIQCAVVTLSSRCKDISEVNQQYGIDEVRRLIDNIVWPTNTDFIRIRDNRNDLLEVLKGNYDHGYSLGYGPLTDQRLKLTGEGGLIVVTGRPGSGKTDWVRCTMSQLISKQQKHVAFLSFEEPNKYKQVRHIVQLTTGIKDTSTIDPELLDNTLNFLDEHMVNLTMDNVEPRPGNIISVCESLRNTDSFPLDFLCIDPYLFLMSENPTESETQQIKQTLTMLQSWGRRNHIWIVMVAHPRKLVKEGMGEYEDVDEYTISGSAHWANLADFLISVRRVFPGGDSDDGSAAPSFTVIKVLKVRDQDICHTGRLYFLRQPCGRYEEYKDEDECKRMLLTKLNTNRNININTN